MLLTVYFPNLFIEKNIDTCLLVNSVHAEKIKTKIDVDILIEICANRNKSGIHQQAV
jgi:hypothetical protein